MASLFSATFWWGLVAQRKERDGHGDEESSLTLGRRHGLVSSRRHSFPSGLRPQPMLEKEKISRRVTSPWSGLQGQRGCYT